MCASCRFIEEPIMTHVYSRLPIAGVVMIRTTAHWAVTAVLAVLVVWLAITNFLSPPPVGTVEVLAPPMNGALELTSSGENASHRISNVSFTETGRADLAFGRARGTQQSPIPTRAGDELGAITWDSYRPGSFSDAAKIGVDQYDDAGFYVPAIIRFFTSEQEVSFVERMNISAAGIRITVPLVLEGVEQASECDESARGTVVFNFGGEDEADRLLVCMKKADGEYGWGS
jgi:hypothetical protein